jgi:pentatricopeptide repeat protein
MEKSKQILNPDLYPLGSFTSNTWKNSKRLLEWWMSLETPGGVKMALRILERCVREQKFVTSANFEDAKASKDGSWLTDDNKLLDRFLKSWRKCATQDKRVIPPIELLSRLSRLADTLPGFRVDTQAFYIILRVAVNQSPPDSVAMTAEALLSYALKRAARRRATNIRPEIQLNTHIWRQILNAYRKSDSQDAPEQAHTVLNRIRGQGAEPNKIIFHHLIHVHALRGNTSRSEDLIRQMLQEYENGNKRVKPGIVSCNLVLLSYLKSSERDDAERAEKFLDIMRQGTIPDAQPDSVSYNTVMLCFAKAGDAKGAEAVVERMKNHFGKDFKQTANQLSTSQGILIEGWANARNPEKAEEMLRDVLEKDLINPSLRMFNAVLKAWAMSSNPNACERAKHILDLLQENDRCVALALVPTANGFNSYLSCVAKSNQTDAGKESEAVICRMEELFGGGNANAKPDRSSFTIAIKTCLRCSDQVRAEALLQKAHESGIPPEYLDQIRKTEPLTIIERAGQILSTLWWR